MFSDWFVNEYVGGETGLAHPSVHGFFFVSFEHFLSTRMQLSLIRSHGSLMMVRTITGASMTAALGSASSA